MALATDAGIMRVLTLKGKPVNTINLGLALGLDEYDNWPRLRRALDRLEDEGMIVSSGLTGNRSQLPGWPTGDRRAVYWATNQVASYIEQQVEAELGRKQDREGLLRELFDFCTPEQRRVLNLTGLHAGLRADPDYHTATGAPSWSVDELEVLFFLMGEG